MILSNNKNNYKKNIFDLKKLSLLILILINFNLFAPFPGPFPDTKEVGEAKEAEDAKILSASFELVEGVSECDIRQCRAALEAGACPDCVGEEGIPVLITATSYGGEHARKIAGLLLESGADVNIRSDADGSAPIHFAADTHDSLMIKLLMEHGANPKLRDNAGSNALKWYLKDTRMRKFLTPEIGRMLIFPEAWREKEKAKKLAAAKEARAEARVERIFDAVESGSVAMASRAASFDRVVDILFDGPKNKKTGYSPGQVRRAKAANRRFQRRMKASPLWPPRPEGVRYRSRGEDTRSFPESVRVNRGLAGRSPKPVEEAGDGFDYAGWAARFDVEEGEDL